jgi:hypothetical protein
MANQTNSQASTVATLPRRLKLYTAGVPASAAAVELLIAQRTRLRRTDFLEQFTYTYEDYDTGLTSTGISWSEAITALDQGHLACSRGEARILRIAASLARGIPVDLREAMTGPGHRGSSARDPRTRACFRRLTCRNP